MSHIWTFSPSSEPLLQRCIEAALLQESDNDWTRVFGRKNYNSSKKSDTPAEKTTTEVIEIPPSPVEEEPTEVSVSYDDFLNNIESEIRIDFIAKECAKNPDLLLQMSQKLSANTVEKLFNLVFASKDIEEAFLTQLFYKFLPQYVKLQHSWLCVNLLAKTNHNYPEVFKKLLKILLEDVEIPNQLLSNYVTILDEKSLSIFIENLSNINMTTEGFVHNLLTIYTVYKDCKKTNKIQDYVKSNLLQHAKSCTGDRNYGRLFLTFLQAEKMLGHNVSRNLENCLEMHHSPFKRPCAILMNELVEDE